MLTTHYVPGTPNWLDLGAPDIDAAVSFYAAVFGWTFQSAGPDAGGYGFFQLDGRTVAAIGPLTEEGAGSAWTVYFQTPDADATVKAVEQAGGSVRVPPMDVFTAGRLAAFTDPAGGDFAVWQPGDVQGLETVMEPNSLCWTELYTTDAAAAKDFYRSGLLLGPSGHADGRRHRLLRRLRTGRRQGRRLRARRHHAAAAGESRRPVRPPSGTRISASPTAMPPSPRPPPAAPRS